MRGTALASPEAIARAEGLTWLDKCEVIEALTASDLRVLARHMARYAPGAFSRALAERISVVDRVHGGLRLAAATAERAGRTA